MREDIAQEWASLLESGTCLQGKMLLHARVNGEDRYCCLGVLCEMAVTAGVIPAGVARNVTDDSDYYMEYIYGREGAAAGLPQEVMTWAGISGNLGEFSTRMRSLSVMNDKGMPFTDIARVIRENSGTL